VKVHNIFLFNTEKMQVSFLNCKDFSKLPLAYCQYVLRSLIKDFILLDFAANISDRFFVMSEKICTINVFILKQFHATMNKKVGEMFRADVRRIVI